LQYFAYPTAPRTNTAHHCTQLAHLVYQNLVYPPISTLYNTLHNIHWARACATTPQQVQTDGDGLVPSSLEAILAGWDAASMGKVGHSFYYYNLA
jgi:hypothetical protein